MSSIRINLTRTGCCVLFSALALICSLPSHAGTEEVSLYSMSNNWDMGYDASTHTLTCSSAWQGRGWNFNGKSIDSNIESFTIEFASATTTNGTVTVRYSYNNENYTKELGFDSGATGITIDMHTDFGNDTYSLDYILIKAAAVCTITLSRAYFTTTGNSDVYQAENADYLGATLENLTSADNSIVPITEGTHYVDFTINVPYAAVYRLNIGYSTKNFGDKGGKLTINNGGAISYTFTGTGASEVKEIAYSTVLQAGNNHVKISADHTHFYIDYLRVYEPTLYLLGENHGTNYTSAPNLGALMTFDSETETFSITTRIGKGDNQATAANFYFATTLAEYNNDGGWSYMNGHRWGPDAEHTNVTTDGNTEITNIAKRGWNSYKVPMAGTYTITMKADLTSFTIQGPEVYMFGLFEGSEYTWATNAYNTMDYNPETNKYTLRVRIANGEATTGDGAVAFATGYSDNNWDYVNANRYGPSSDATPSTDGTTNDIARNGATAFINIPAHKYEVVVDMFSATKTAQFYPLYTFGYEVVGTYKHGSITCSTNDTEIPRGSGVTVTAVPNEGYQFVKWTDADDQQLSTSAEYSPTITADTWLKAWFELDPSSEQSRLTIPANTFAFAKHNNDVYSAADGSFLHEESGAMYFNYTYNDGSELFYPVHLNEGTYHFYCTLSADGTERKMRLYAQDEVSGTLQYSGKKWRLSDSHDFGTGAATFETKGFTVTTGDYLIALYAKQNTRFSQIEVVGAAGGATANTVALTLSAGANGSVISNQINNAKILSRTSVLLLAEPDEGYRFEQWDDGNTDNPRTVTMTEASSLTASFNQTNGCLNTLTRECESDAVTPSTAPKAVPTTHVSEGRIIDENTDRMLYYAFEITEPVTASFTLLTATSDKRQKFYLYSAQANAGTELVYNTVTYRQLGEPVEVNSPNSGENHVYPVSSGAVLLDTGKYVVGLYSEYSWSQYDRLVLSAGADNIDCYNADITINANDQVCLPHVVRNLTVYQGGVATNTHDVQILNTITYIRHAVGGGADNQINHWYPFCLPFTPLSQSAGGCQVYDNDDGQWYNINPVYRRNEDTEDNPQGEGYFYLEYMKNEGDLSAVGNEFRTRWAYIERDMPEAYVPYIILFVNQWSDGPDDYFENNPVVRFVGGRQTIEGTAKTDRIADEGVEKYYYYANNTLAPISLSSAYTFANNNFDYREDVTVAPFECYIQATETYKARHKSIAMPRKPGAQDTATATDYTPNNNACRSYIFDITGRLIANNTERLPRGVYICKQGNETRKLIIY